MEKYTAIIVDDDAITILLLKRIIAEFCPAIKVIGTASTVETAIGEIERNNPDIVFLDIMLKDSISFEIIDRLEKKIPQVIFITSESKFAIQAFQYNAVHYIMKPLKPDEVIMALQKATNSLVMQNYYLSKIQAKPMREVRNLIAISSMDKIDLIREEEIMFFSSEGRYTNIYTINGKKLLSPRNLGDYERLLDQGLYYRTHHSYIINMQYVARIVKKEGFYCEMTNGHVVPISKRRREDFSKFLRVKE
jgi:two-component system, LytTR family, response regulator